MGADPITAGVMVLSAGIEGIGQIAAGNANAAASKYNAQVAEQNAKIAEQNARWVGADADQRLAMEGMKNKERLGRITTNQAASGLDLNKGSAADVRTSQSMIDKLDSLTIRSNAAREAYGLQTQAQSYKADAAMSRSRAKYERRAGYIAAASTVLGKGAEAYRTAYPLPSESKGNSVLNETQLPSQLPWKNEPNYSSPYAT